MASPLRASVVIATFNRGPLSARLLKQLGEQTLEPAAFEVVVVDDGSLEPASKWVATEKFPYALRVERQENAGAAAARHRGALLALGEILVILDDDMQVGPEFLTAHLAYHEGARRVVLEQMRPDGEAVQMALFERWHQHLLERMASEFRQGVRPRGNALYTGNVSMRREDYLAVGGFDASLKRSEDAELGIRLEASGVEFVFSEEAYSINGSDHTSFETWARRARLYGVFDHRISRKHPDAMHANPWRFLFQLSAPSRPWMVATFLAPKASQPLATAVYGLADRLDRMGLTRLAYLGTGVTYGLEYFRGLRDEVALEDGAREVAEYARARANERLEQLRQGLFELIAAVQEDHRVMRQYEGRYSDRPADDASIARDLAQKAGFQMMAAYRLMRWFRASGQPLAAKVASRMIRHLYGADIHWDAELAPGVMIVHGMGICISHSAKVSSECILFQNVTLGMGVDAQTRASGAPTLEPRVHVGAGATLVGPLTIGEGSKIMAGAVVMRSVPPGSLVETPAPTAAPRQPKAVRKKHG